MYHLIFSIFKAALNQSLPKLKVDHYWVTQSIYKTFGKSQELQILLQKLFLANPVRIL